MAASGRGRSCAAAAALVWLNLSCVWGATYIVGDSQGWNLGVNYKAWAAKKTFRAGDVLIFTYTLLHSVVEVSQTDFATCTINSINTFSTGNDSVVLSSTKSAQFFICGTGGHCNGGMALQINIAPAAATPPAPAPTAPVPAPLKQAPDAAPSPASLKAPIPQATPAPGTSKAPATSPPAPSKTSAGSTPPAPAPKKSSGFSLAAASSSVSLLTFAAIAALAL